MISEKKHLLSFIINQGRCGGNICGECLLNPCSPEWYTKLIMEGTNHKDILSSLPKVYEHRVLLAKEKLLILLVDKGITEEELFEEFL